MAFGKIPASRRLREKNAQIRRKESEAGADVVNKTVSTLNPSLDDVLNSYEKQADALKELQERKHQVTGDFFDQVHSHDDLMGGLTILEKGRRVAPESEKKNMDYASNEKIENELVKDDVTEEQSVSELLDWYKEFESKNEGTMPGFRRR